MMGRLKTAAAMLIAVSACGTDSSGPEPGRYGRYTLRSINGNRPPAVLFESATSRLEFLSGTLRLNSDQTFTDSTELKVTPLFRGDPLQGGEVRQTTDVAWGLLRFAGDTVYLTSTRGEQYYMVFQVTGSLTQTLAGARLLYRR
jgi:hypothetical protein